MGRRTESELTRSERVRQRRAEQTQQTFVQVGEAPRTPRKPRTSSQSRNVRYAAEVPPITMRGTMGTPVLHRTSTTVRRKVSIPTNQPGTEIQLPSLPIINPGWRLLSGFLTIFLAVILYMAWNSPTFQISSAKVVGNDKIPAGDILQASGILDEPIFAVDPQEAQKEIATQFPDLSDITVKVALPASVVISAVEKTPAVVWEMELRSVWTDSSGMVIPARGDAGNIPAIQVQGDLPMYMQISEEEEETSKTKTTAEQAADSNQPLFVDQGMIQTAQLLQTAAPEGAVLTYSIRNGFGWSEPSGWKVCFGTSLDDLDQKLAVYRESQKALEAKGIQPGLINVEHAYAPFYRTEQ